MTYGRPITRVLPEGSVGSIMSWPVAAVEAGASVAEVAEALTADEVGAVVVVERAAMVGIVSERDLVAHLASGAGREPVAGDLMSQELVTVTPETTVVEAARAMREAQVRHLPVLSDGLIAGVVSVRDLFEVLLRHAESRSHRVLGAGSQRGPHLARWVFGHGHGAQRPWSQQPR